MRSFRSAAVVLLLTLIPLPGSASEPADWMQLHGMISEASPIKGSKPAQIPEAGPVVVTFFASWCPPCTDEFKHLNALVADENLDGGSIVAINLFEDFGGKKNPARMARFIKQTGPQFPLIAGTEEMRIAFGDITRIPTVVVYDRSGKEVWRFVHERNATKTHVTLEELRQALNEANSE